LLRPDRPLASPSPSSLTPTQVIVAGFCFALIGLSETATHHTHLIQQSTIADAVVGNARGALTSLEEGELALVWQPFFAMFAEFDIDELMKVPYGLPLMWVYVLIANVVLINMLIAMFTDTYTRIKINAEIEYRYQLFMHIFEYQHVVHHLPPPFNAPLLLWDSCKACFAGRAGRERAARMDFDVFAGDMDMYGGPSVIGLQGGTPLSRKFVQRYLKKHSAEMDGSQGIATRVERLVNDMEERMHHEFEHMHTAITHPSSGSTSNGSFNGGGGSQDVNRKLTAIIGAIDRLARGEAGKAKASAASAASAISSMKPEAVRDGTPPSVSKRSATPTKPGAGGKGKQSARV